MKKIFLVISIIAILAIVCSPVLAISKADLISQYKGQSASTIPTIVPTTTPTIPTPTPTPYIPMPKGSSPTLTTDIFLVVNSTPTGAMVFIDGSYRGLTPITIRPNRWGLSVGIHHFSMLRAGYEDYSTEVLIPESSCHPGTGPSGDFFECHPITIDVTLKKIESTLKPTIPTIIPSPTPTPAPLTPDIYPQMPASYPYIPASYYEWSKLPAPAEPTPRVISDEEWKEITDRYSRVFA
jgi:hypothetical protein